MVDRGGVPVKAVVFVVVLCLALVGIVIHAVEEHGDDRAVHLDPVPSDADPTESVTGSPTSSVSASIPTPKPQSVTVGPAICGSGDYHLTRHTMPDPETGTPTGKSYNVIATYTGPAKSHCIFTEYPRVTVRGIAGKRRSLNPAGGFVDGYGQPPPTSLSQDSPARSFLLVENESTNGKACNKETSTFRDVELAGLKLVPRISGWCTMAESPWQPVGQTLTDNSTPGPPTCKPYNLKLASVPAPIQVGKHLTYTFTVKHKNGADCVLDDFPHLAATVSTGSTTNSIHQMKLTHNPEGPSITLSSASPEATTEVVISTGRCAGPQLPLTQLRVENLFFKLHPINVPKWCSITESYWRPGS